VTDYQDWIGKSDEITDTLTISPAQRMAATLNRSDIFVQGTALPPLWHWMYFLPTTRLDDISADGHARRGTVLPPIVLPRRMFAGSRMVFHRPLHIGERALKKSTIANITSKQGKSGALTFLLLRHEIIGEEGLALLEEQDIVYREALGVNAASGQPAPAEAQWSLEIVASPMLLFRYSALTFNTHRIHYDRDFCTNVEGYPGLVVHGQLTATFLLEGLRQHAPERVIKNYGFKAVGALYDTQPFRVEGRIDGDTAQLWALDQEGNLAMTATVGLG
jgi:3-methylfumaryl-CoA hydratase